MEEKLKASDSQSGDSEVRLFERCQELQALVQEKEEVITQLGQQLEEQVKGALTNTCPFSMVFSTGFSESKITEDFKDKKTLHESRHNNTCIPNRS